MKIDEYQRLAGRTAVYPDKGANLTYPILGLVGEAGELANKYKKILRGDAYVNNLKYGMIDELGDVLWYVAAVASELGFSLAEIAADNLRKLALREASGTVKGSGDKR
jgi:NTP pyrophosphatase (non-canonical NTP hydrolase)